MHSSFWVLSKIQIRERERESMNTKKFRQTSEFGKKEGLSHKTFDKLKEILLLVKYKLQCITNARCVANWHNIQTEVCCSPKLRDKIIVIISSATRALA